MCTFVFFECFLAVEKLVTAFVCTWKKHFISIYFLNFQQMSLLLNFKSVKGKLFGFLIIRLLYLLCFVLYYLIILQNIIN